MDRPNNSFSTNISMPSMDCGGNSSVDDNASDEDHQLPLPMPRMPAGRAEVLVDSVVSRSSTLCDPLMPSNTNLTADHFPIAISLPLPGSPLARNNDDEDKKEKSGLPARLTSESKTDSSGRTTPALRDLKALEAGIRNGGDDDEMDMPTNVLDEKRSNQDSEGVLIVDWDGPDDPEDPKNWSYRQKWGATLIVSAFTFISPVSSSITAPVTEQLAIQFRETNTTVLAMMTSIFVLAYAIGPLFLGPLSEMYGRSRVLQIANMWYLVWNLACGFSTSTAMIICFRFVAGLGGSAPLAIGGGLIADCWRAEERGRAIALFSLAPLLGPVVGPIAGAWIAQKSTWKWVFWSTSIVDGVIQVLGILYLRETFEPVLLERKAAKIKAELGIPRQDNVRVRTKYQGEDRQWKNLFAKAMVRPFAIFFHEPIIQLLGAYMAFIYGLVYLMITTIPLIFVEIYGEEIGIAGLNYVALGIGLTCSSQINARLLDRVYASFKRKNGGVGKPEFRLPSMIPGTLALPAGLFIAGWAAANHVHWAVTDLGILLVGVGMILNFQSIQAYVIDVFTLHAASALAAVFCLRSLAGFGFPLFAPAMYNALGYGKGDSILAGVAIVIGCPAPFILWRYGERIRKASRYAGSTL